MLAIETDEKLLSLEREMNEKLRRETDLHGAFRFLQMSLVRATLMPYSLFQIPRRASATA